MSSRKFWKLQKSCQDFGSSDRCGQEKFKLPLLTGLWWLWKQRLSTPACNWIQSEESGWVAHRRKKMLNAGDPYFWEYNTYIWRKLVYITVWRTLKWKKQKLWIALKAAFVNSDISQEAYRLYYYYCDYYYYYYY